MKRVSLFKKVERINKLDENSNYKVVDTLYNAFSLLYEDPIFNEEGSKPVIINEDLLKIEDKYIDFIFLYDILILIIRVYFIIKMEYALILFIERKFI